MDNGFRFSRTPVLIYQNKDCIDCVQVRIYTRHISLCPVLTESVGKGEVNRVGVETMLIVQVHFNSKASIITNR